LRNLCASGSNPASTDNSMIESQGGTRSLVVAGKRSREISIREITVTVENGPDRGARVTVTTPTLCIGTSAHNDLVLTDTTVSRSHIVLRAEANGILVEDQQTKNGTWLGGTRLVSGFVPDGERLVLGQTTIRIRATLDQICVSSEDDAGGTGVQSRSQAMREVWAFAQRLARYNVSVSITGETGTGKELIAHTLHDAGPRRDRSFQVLDCGAVVKELLSSELFGHEKGAFTGADAARKGVFEAADGGTVFLDEVGELDLALQPHLLRVLETRQICRLGSRQPVGVNFRLVSATHRNLKKLVQEGRFREDLFYRLSAVAITLPPLRDRREDIEALLQHFLARCAEENGVNRPVLSARALALLEAYEWPGNVRELRNVADSLCVLADGSPVLPDHVAQVLEIKRAAPRSLAAEKPESEGTEPEERQRILDALSACGWNRKLAAQKLGMSRTSLYSRLRAYGIRRPGE
jgi:DNA-binding NtrC family response regulator